MFELKNWYLTERHGAVVAKGNCYGNPKFPDGCPVHTSPIVNVETDDGGVVITTKRSVYYGAFGERKIIDSNLDLVAKIEGCSLSESDISAIEERTLAARKRGQQQILV